MECINKKVHSYDEDRSFCTNVRFVVILKARFWGINLDHCRRIGHSGAFEYSNDVCSTAVLNRQIRLRLCRHLVENGFPVSSYLLLHFGHSDAYEKRMLNKCYCSK